ncbi:sigma factor-like helix-turn-helix DNA-binding protein [Geodermatophilus obscurus]|uniref:Sigma-70 region 4 domain protein n=1 Tax=Geodermatophilus obscurus (strain ATCC 25078 / DSM 43160 / JCM 3152 / CCUG 61914 / KCC A-0152 / KCTC 9177 / NBRC 13315 / NRRL B-3577 / G-20) TaxID=526225 RepID=D2S898_GEOOG|nr:sigma factor-like helix-turn-helix DNA-binding protein [Geodermatophilus obscurus]ADB73520.1 sigma-70 region 4 domain protein [Geodermatophilus obscurus DSM 43160]
MPDSASFPAWGEPGTPVLPAAVRERAADTGLHRPLLESLGINPAASADAVFTHPLVEPVDQVLFGAAVRGLLNRGLGASAAMGRAGELLRLVDPDDFEALVPQIGWRLRTSNAVRRACTSQSMSVHELLMISTVSELLDLPGLGVLTLFDLLVGVEIVLAQVVGAEGSLALVGSQEPGPGQQEAAHRAPPRAWGEQGSPVLPAVLTEWSSTARSQTDALLAALGLPEATPACAKFDHPVDEPFQAARLGAALWDLVASGVGSQPAMGSAAPVLQALDPATFSRAIEPLLRTRTRNVIRREFGARGLLEFLLTATVDDVLSLRHFGVVSFLDLLVAAEAAVTVAASPNESPGSSGAQPLQLPDRPPWEDAVTADDPRFRPLLGRAASLGDLFEDAGPPDLTRLRRTVEDAEHILHWLKGFTLEEEAESVLRAALGKSADKWLEALGSRYGLAGADPQTLDEVGRTLGVTRERVRQVQSKAQAHLPSAPVHAPAVDQALELLDWALPCSAEDLTAALAAAGLTSLPCWTADAFRAAVGLTGRTVDIGERDGLLGRADQLRAAAMVTGAARAVSNAHGIASVASVTRRLARGTDEPVPHDTVEATLRVDASVHWIDEHSFWTDHPAGRNRLVNTSLRILAVISPQSLDDLLEGIERDFAFRAADPQYADLAAPAPAQLAAFYASHPAFRPLPDGRIETTDPIDVDSLGEEKQALVAVLRGQPHQAMDRLSLLAACDEIGMKRATVTVWTTYAECLKRFGHNVWGLRGADVPAEVVAELQEQARAARRAVDRTKIIGVTPSGRPWTARRITPSFLYSGVMAFDWGKDALAHRTLAAVDIDDGQPAGSLRFADNFNWGYNVFLNRHNAQVGDVLRVLADPDNDICYLEIGGDELLGEPFDA